MKLKATKRVNPRAPTFFSKQTQPPPTLSNDTPKTKHQTNIPPSNQLVNSNNCNEQRRQQLQQHIFPSQDIRLSKTNSISTYKHPQQQPINQMHSSNVSYPMQTQPLNLNYTNSTLGVTQTPNTPAQPTFYTPLSSTAELVASASSVLYDNSHMISHNTYESNNHCMNNVNK